MERTDQPTPQHTPAPAKPNPAAAAYLQAAASYEDAARDAAKLGAHQRADAHRRRAADYRNLAAAYTTSNPNPDELLRRARALAVTR